MFKEKKVIKEILEVLGKNKTAVMMVDEIIEVLNADGYNRKNAEYIEPEKEVYFSWHLDDVMGTDSAKENNLTEEEGQEVLALMESEYDCTIGVSWDVIDVWIDKVVSERKGEKR